LIEPRIYRAAFIPALFAVVIAMFSLESRPPSVQQALAADVLFDGRVAGNVSSFAHPTRDKPHELGPEQKGRRS